MKSAILTVRLMSFIVLEYNIISVKMRAENNKPYQDQKEKRLNKTNL